MFRCGICDDAVGPGIEARKVVLETRDIEYINIRKKGTRYEESFVTTGTEIVEEVQACDPCYVIKTGTPLVN